MICARTSGAGTAPGARTRGVHGTSQFLEQMAGALRSAYHGDAIAPFGTTVPYPNIGLACAIQETNTRFWIAQGRKPAGRIVRLCGRAEQAARGATEPVYGMVFADMLASPGAGLPVHLRQPVHVTPAIALRLAQPVLAVPSSPAELRMMIAAVLPVIDVQQSRLDQWRGDLFDEVADHASLGRLVIGPEGSPTWLDRAEDVRASVTVGDAQHTVAHTGIAGSQALAAADWLVRKMLFLGRPMQAEDLIVLATDRPAVPLMNPVAVSVRWDGLEPCAAHLEAAA